MSLSPLLALVLSVVPGTALGAQVPPEPVVPTTPAAPGAATQGAGETAPAADGETLKKKKLLRCQRVPILLPLKLHQHNLLLEHQRLILRLMPTLNLLPRHLLYLFLIAPNKSPVLMMSLSHA